MLESIVIISTLFFFILVYTLYLILKMYDKKKQEYVQELDKFKFENEKNLLNAQVEIQEQTFQNISREIHDNIGQKLSLAKLYLNTANMQQNPASGKISQSVHLISDVMNDLSDISRSLSSDLIQSDGLVKAMQFEMTQLEKTDKYNVVKHADCSAINIILCFTGNMFTLTEMTYKEIANTMNMTPRKIDHLRDMLFEKLGVKSRVGLAMYAIKHELLTF